MSTHFREMAEQIATDGTIAPEEILILRRAAWSDGKIDVDEAEAICAVNHRITAPDAAWTEFFVEALGDYIINGALPLGEIDEAKAGWLIAHADSANGWRAELALLVKLFERTGSAPERLRSHAIDRIERAVLADGTIADAEALLLRRLIFAPASGRATGVDRAEAELLFKLKDATLDADNGSEWARLFVQGLGNYLIVYTSYEPLTRERAGDLDRFMANADAGLARFVAQMGARGLLAGFTGFAREASEDEALLDSYEQALMDFLGEERGR